MDEFLLSIFKLKVINIKSKNIYPCTKYNQINKDIIKDVFNRLKYKKEQEEALISSDNFDMSKYINLYINNFI